MMRIFFGLYESWFKVFINRIDAASAIIGDSYLSLVGDLATLMTGNFRIEEALAASARVAYLNAILLQDEIVQIEYYKEQDISELTIEKADWAFLNRLKRQPDKSIFYYWYKAVTLLTD